MKLSEQARQFNAVEPENRLVARTLEKLGHEKLQLLAELESAYTQAQMVERLEISDEQRQQILNLARDIPTVWHSPTTTARFAKRNVATVGEADRPYPYG